ncbi:MAG: hypothetical protein Q9217_002192 [Psora testacea]
MASDCESSSEDEEDEEADILDLESDEGWDDVEPDVEQLEVQCLFDNRVFANVASMLQHCKDDHHFDLALLQKGFKLEFIEMIKLVNYIRSQTQAGRLSPELSTKAVFKDDRYLYPVLEDDPLLYSLHDVISDERSEDEELANGSPSLDVKVIQASKPEESLPRFRDYEQQLATTQEALETSAKQLQLTEKALEQANICTDSLRQQLEETTEDGPKRTFNKQSEYQEKDDCYSGIFLHGNIQEISLPIAKVDVIISEWMGYCLLYEGMLDSILWARDRYLKLGGLMIPAHATLCIAPMAEDECFYDRVGFWKSVYGFDMSAMSESIERHIDTEIVLGRNICGSTDIFKSFSMYSAKVEDLEFAGAEFKSTIDKDASDGMQGLVIWFDTYFSTTPGFRMGPNIPSPDTFLERGEGNVAFTTGPFGEPTHWAQGILLFEHRKGKPKEVKTGQIMTGTVGYKKGTAPGSLEVSGEWRMDDEEVMKRQTWVLD